VKRIRIPWLVDLVISEDAAEIETLAQDSKLDRAYSDRSVLINGLILGRVRKVLDLDGKPFPTVSPRSDEDRAAAQEALWKRLSALAPALSEGPAEVESLAAFVRGEGPEDACGQLVQQVIGALFSSSFKATPASWSAAQVLDKAPRTMNPILLVWWAITGRVPQAKQILSEMVGGDPAAVHAVGVAIHNIVNGVILMRQLYSDSVERNSLTPQVAGGRSIFAPPTILRQPTSPDSSAEGVLGTGTVVMLKLQAAHAKSSDPNLAFLRNSWSRCPAEQWVPALLEGVWRRACRSQSKS
jgi:hypothetical protein